MQGGGEPLEVLPVPRQPLVVPDLAVPHFTLQLAVRGQVEPNRSEVELLSGSDVQFTLWNYHSLI